MQEDSGDQSYKIKYYDLKEAFNEVSDSIGGKEKSIASAKLLGKTMFNTALFSGRAMIKSGKEMLEHKEKHQHASVEDLLRLKERGSFSERAAASSILKEREEKN
ncbi:hypothetical protein CLM76_13640 [Vreelandella venusta]|nr:hypothetical protein CLM76_13640 [Halomonas hydrothermalis]